MPFVVSARISVIVFVSVCELYTEREREKKETQLQLFGTSSFIFSDYINVKFCCPNMWQLKNLFFPK